MMHPPEAIVCPELQQLKWGYEAELALLGHVEVIDEGNQALATSWHKDTLGTLLKFALNCVLST